MNVAKRYAAAGIDRRAVVDVEHYEDANGEVRAGVRIDDWLIALQVLRDVRPRCECHRPLVDGPTCAKCGRQR